MTPTLILDLFTSGNRGHATHAPRDPESLRIHPLVYLEDVDRLIAVTGVREPFFALSNARTAIYPFNSWRFHDPAGWCADARIILREALRAGTTLILRHIHLHVPAIRALVLALKRECPSLSVQVNCYLTPPDSDGVPPHTDPRDTLLIQQHGSKRWRVWARADTLASDNAGGHAPDSPSLELTLSPGDLLFIPAGCLHHSTTQSEHSMHLTFGILDRSALDNRTPSLTQSDEIIGIV